MFYNYQNIADNYMPNNLMNAFPTKHKDSKLNPLEASKPYEEYNAKGELEGYYWRYGETLNLEFNIDGEITIESDALVVSGKGQAPDNKTIGEIGQRYYNVGDLKSYTCLAAVNGLYLWQEDEDFTYPVNEDRSVYISAEDYLNGKTAEVTIYNFRMEPVCQKVYAASPKIRFFIDSELSRALVKGIYYCSVRVFDNMTNVVAFDTTDCKLLVK